jgi:transcriptional regulator with GAF, ATPase, and Fis domain
MTLAPSAVVENKSRVISEPKSNKMNFNRVGIAGTSKGLIKVLDIVRKVSKSDSSALITGESGTGKELIAKAIHKNSSRGKSPLVVINCGAIPGELLESELFGHEKGAFTGAHRSRTGRFELADKGTIFLDEIGDMSPDLQVKLLRAIQERQFERVGGSTTIKVDIRVISATNKDLPSAIEDGVFREDLYYRLNVIPIHIQPLRERKEDILVLCDYFQKTLIKRVNGYQKKNFCKEVEHALVKYDWPGNIRELENLIERISVLVEEQTIELHDLPEYIINNSCGNMSTSVTSVFDNGVGFNKAVEQYQKSLIIHALDETRWVKARAAALLQMNRTTLVEKIKKMKIEPKSEMPVF